MKSNRTTVSSQAARVSVSQAAERLSVHIATVRRWADQGEISFMLTPGRHRRFLLTDIEAFAAGRTVNAGIKDPSVPEAWASRAIERTRTHIRAQSGTRWMAALDDEMREKHRMIGRKLMALTMQYLSAKESGASEYLLHEAHAVGHEYGVASRGSGITLSDGLQAALFFRDKLLEAALDLPESTHPRNTDQRELIKRINALLNTVQLAMAGVYENESPIVRRLPGSSPAKHPLRKASMRNRK